MAFWNRKKPKRRPRGAGPKLESRPRPKAAGGVAPSKYAPTRHRSAPKTKRRMKRSGESDGRGFWTRKNILRMLSLLFTFALLGIGFLLYLAQDLPNISKLETLVRQPGITVKTEDGLVIGTFGEVYGEYVTYDEMPKHLIKAVLATEDRNFYRHFGVDPLGILRAMIVNARAGRFVQGGSTITQQIAKNVFLTPDRTLQRKVEEMLLAIWIEARYTKKEILAIYLNRMYLGAGTYGVDAASRRYFDKPATEVNVVEAAVLAGLLKAPSKYAPTAGTERAKARAHQVLLNMVDAGYMDADRVESALAEFTPTKTYREGDDSGSRYFADWVVDLVPELVGNVESDITVIATMNPVMQRYAEETVEALLKEHGEKLNVTQAALVSMRPDGRVEAMVGGEGYRTSPFNRAVQALRHPGSAYKIMVYLAALEAGYGPDTLVEDKPVEIYAGPNQPMWRPTNFDGKYRGEITLTQALTESLNTVAAQLGQEVGIDNVAAMSRRLGITDVFPGPSLVLGAAEVNLLQMTTAFAHLANEGRGVEPWGILRIESKEGEVLFEREEKGLWVVLRQSVVERMNYMLQNVVNAGTGGRARALGRPVAGKTGTSQDFKDAWFIGFVPQLVTGVWVGNDDNTPTKRVTGGNLPTMIWTDYMKKALEGEPVRSIPSSSTGSDSILPWQTGLEVPLDAQPAADGTLPSTDVLTGEGTPQAPAAKGESVDLSPGFWGALFGDDRPAPAAAPEPPPIPPEAPVVDFEYPASSPREGSLEVR